MRPVIRHFIRRQQINRLYKSFELCVLAGLNTRKNTTYYGYVF